MLGQDFFRRRGLIFRQCLVALLGAGMLLLFVHRSSGQAENQQSILAGVISSALSSPDIKVSIGAVEGALASKSTIRDIVLSDREGAFLSVDQVQLEWRRAALLSRRLEVNHLRIGRIDYRRKPTTASGAAKSGEALLPELPLKLLVKAFDLGEIALAEPVFGQAARLGAVGRITLGLPSEGLDSEIAITRLDREGAITLKLLFVPKGETLLLNAHVNEGKAGLIAHLAAIPESPPVTLDLAGDGPLDDWKASLTFQAGTTIDGAGTARLLRQGAGRNLALDLSGRVGTLLPSLAAGLFPGQTSLTLRAGLKDDGTSVLEQAKLVSDLAELDLSGTLTGGRDVDLALRLAARPGTRGQARYRDTTIEALTLDARVTGPFRMPSVSGSLHARAMRQPGFGFAAADARFMIRQAGELPGAVDIEARVDGLKLATPEATRAAGGEITLALKGALDANLVTEFTQASLTSPTARIGWTGKLGPGVAAGRIAGTIPELAVFDRRIKGSATLAGTLDGQGEGTMLALELLAPKLELIGHPLRDLVAGISARDPFGKAVAAIKATGTLDKAPLVFSARLLHDEGRSSVQDLEFLLGTNRIQGALTHELGAIAGKILVDMPKIDQLSGLLLTPVSGMLAGQVEFSAGTAGKQRMVAAFSAPAINAFGASFRGLDANVTLDDAFAQPCPLGRVRAEAAAYGKENFGRVMMLTTGSAARCEIVLDAKGVGTTIGTTLGIDYGTETVLDLARFTAQRAGSSVKLAAPARLRVRDGNTHVDSLAFVAGGGSLTLSGKFGQETALKIRAGKLSLASMRALVPGLDLAGILDAEADLTGDITHPSGTYRMNVTGFSHPALRQAAIPALAIRASGAVAAGRAELDASVSGGSKLALAIHGAVPLDDQGSLDLAVRGTLDASLGNVSLAGGGQRLAGVVKVDAGIKGARSAIMISGNATLAGGSFVDPLQGVRFSNISGRFSGAGERILVEQLSASTPGGGTLALSGSIIADPVRGLPADLRLRGSKARLIENDVMILVADLDLAVTGALAHAPLLEGAVRIASLDVMIPDRLASALAPLPNARHIEPPEQTKARLSMIENSRKQRVQRRSATSGARLAIRLDAPSRVAVRGRGIDAELGGSLDLSGTLYGPRASGAFELRRGQIDLLTQRLSFSRGRITFTGDLVPELDFMAATGAGGVSAKVAVTGRADEPVFTLSSEPQLPPDEVLSRLMFERTSGALSPFQAIQLAQAVARLSGKGGPDFLDKTRKALGVDTLDVNMGKSGPNVGVSKYITRDIRVGVKTGATPEESGLSVNVDVSRRIKLQGEATRDGRGTIGIGAEIEY